MLANYHTHTAWSDGQASMSAMIDAAVDAGLSELGCSDHLALHPDGEVRSWSMSVDQLDDYLAAIDLEQRRIGDRLQIRRGLEVDWFPNHGDAIRAVLEERRFDVLIGAVHFVGEITIDGSPKTWTSLDQRGINEVHRRYWHLVREMASSSLFDIAAHLDVVRKFNILPDIDLTAEIDAALDAIADADLVVECNTAGWFKPIGMAYPSMDILARCAARGIPVTLSSDAHRPSDLLRAFAEGAARLHDAGHTHVARFGNRERWLEPIDDAIADVPAATLDVDDTF